MRYERDLDECSSSPLLPWAGLGGLNPRSVCEEQMAFCSYFKIQQWNGLAD